MLFELWFSIAEIWLSVVIIVVFLKCPLNCLCCHPLFGFCVFIKMVSPKAILVNTSATYVEGFTCPSCPSWSFCLFVFLSVFCVLAMNALSVYFRLMSLIFFWPYWNITLCRVQMIYFFLNWRTCNAFLDRSAISTPWPLSLVVVILTGLVYLTPNRTLPCCPLSTEPALTIHCSPLSTELLKFFVAIYLQNAGHFWSHLPRTIKYHWPIFMVLLFLYK